jgi:hypothetical protein
MTYVFGTDEKKTIRKRGETYPADDRDFEPVASA